MSGEGKTLLQRIHAAFTEMDTDNSRPVQVGDFVRVDGEDDFYGQEFDGAFGLVVDGDVDTVKVWVFDEGTEYDFIADALTLVTREEALA